MKHIFAVLLLSLSLSLWAETPSLDEVLALPTSLRAELDSKIRPINRQANRVQALHQLLYGADGLDIRYDNTRTKTAAEVLQTRSGNCLSLAALYIASARYVGLDAQFQAVNIDEEWLEREHTLFFLSHVNARVKLPGQTAIVEFLDTYAGDQSLQRKSRPLSDQEALARFYSNLGAESLASGQWQTAKIQLELAVQTNPKSADPWINLGVLHKRQGNVVAAEQAYLAALKLDSENLSALSNLHALYQSAKRSAEAKTVGERLDRRRMKNPYFLAKLAENAIKAQRGRDAIGYLDKALSMKKEPRFYQLLGQAYFVQGQLAESQKALEQSIRLSSDDQLRQLSQAKLQALHRISHPL